MKTVRKMKSRSRSKLDNPVGFRYLKTDDQGPLDTIPEFHDGGEAHNKMYGLGHPDSAHSQGDASDPFGMNSIMNPQVKSQATFQPIQVGDFKTAKTPVATPDYAADIAVYDEQYNADRLAADTKFLQAQPEAPLKNTLSFEEQMAAENAINMESDPYADTTTGTEQPIEDIQNTQFFNPYGGVDVMGAANIFGQELGKPKGERDALSMVGSGLKIATGLGRSMAAGAGYSKRNDFVLDEFNKKRRSGMLGEPVALRDGGYFEDGGEANERSMGLEGEGMNENQEVLPELLTGDYSTGTENGPSNVEVEKNEYIKTPDGNVTKVLGDTHENEGEDMNVAKGTQIVSDNLQPTKEQAEKLKDEYGIKVKAKDTYAKVMDKFYDVIGLKELIEEEAEIIKSIETQTKKSKEKGADESTFQINLEFLSSRLKDITDEKKPLQAQAVGMFDNVFKMQEKTKPVEKAQTEFKVGGTVYSEADILAIAKKHNLDKDRAFEILKKFANGGSFAEDGLEKDSTEPERARFKEWVATLEKQGFDVPVNLDANDLGSEAGKVQKWMVQNHPEAVVEFFKTNPLTYKGIRALQASEKGKGVFKALGLDPNKAPGTYTDEQKADLTKAARQAGAVTREFLLDQFNDNLWDYRNPVVPNRPKVEGVKADVVGVDMQRDLESPLGMRGKASNTDASKVGLDLSILNNPVGTEIDLRGPLGVETKLDTTVDKERVKGKEVYLLPDQTPLSPTGMQPHLKANRRYGRIDAQQITPDAQLTELNRGVGAAMQELDKLPAGQKEAYLMQLQANKQSQTSELMSKTEAANAQFRQTADAFNLRQEDREEEAKWADLLNYEQRSLGALANTEDDFRRYFNTGQERNVANFNNINALNLMNATYENFDITNDGVQVTGRGPTKEEWLNQVMFNQAVPKAEAAKKKTKTTAAKNGGTVRRGRKR